MQLKRKKTRLGRRVKPAFSRSVVVIDILESLHPDGHDHCQCLLNECLLVYSKKHVRIKRGMENYQI